MNKQYALLIFLTVMTPSLYAGDIPEQGTWMLNQYVPAGTTAARRDAYKWGCMDEIDRQGESNCLLSILYCFQNVIRSFQEEIDVLSEQV